MATEQGSEFGVLLDGGNVIVGFESLEQAINYAKTTWNATISWEYGVVDDYGVGDNIDDPNSPVELICEVTHISDWGKATPITGEEE